MSTMWAASPSELLMRAATRTAGRRRSVTRRRLTLIAGLVMLGLAIAAVTLAPVLVSQSPTTIDPLHPLAPPGTGGHLLGSDQYGRDLLARRFQQPLQMQADAVLRAHQAGRRIRQAARDAHAACPLLEHAR